MMTEPPKELRVPEEAVTKAHLEFSAHQRENWPTGGIGAMRCSLQAAYPAILADLLEADARLKQDCQVSSRVSVREQIRAEGAEREGERLREVFKEFQEGRFLAACGGGIGAEMDALSKLDAALTPSEEIPDEN